MLSHLLPGAAYLHCIPGWFSQQSPWVRVWRCFTVEGNSLNAFPLTTEKVHAEIERVLGPDCPPTFEDRKNMPFTNAVIHEVQRFVTLLPHVPRCTSADTQGTCYSAAHEQVIAHRAKCHGQIWSVGFCSELNNSTKWLSRRLVNGVSITSII